ncbi:MAG TPA: FecR domain-containing protein [Dokdonella sp.]|uniref:FecR family protein n=1 Tax=Dokdonella sp. TaxID=2291710 RepID=UPI002BE8F590|nr:FecR domain-containing protein [Dokdonella sp.]HUD40371.1 FecR domain-containing protein [Dokdonella sp.]
MNASVHDSAVLQRAADWQARLKAPDCSATDRDAFERWCAADPVHVDVWLDVAALDEAAAGLGDTPAIAAAARPARRGTAHAQHRRRWRSGISVAAAAVLMLAAGLIGWLDPFAGVATAEYATAIGEQRALTLADGTQVRLDTDTALGVRIDDAERVLEVRRGRVDLTVAADTRPFEVYAGRGRVRDIGTRFQVEHRDLRVTVAVLEGAVGVRLTDGTAGETALAPGQRVGYGDSGPLAQVEPFDPEHAEAWTRGELIFSDRRLDEVLTEINRYTATPLRLADPSLGAMRISGVFRPSDTASLLAALDAGWSLHARHTADGAIELAR